MTGKRNAVTFSFKVQICFLLVIALLLAGFFAVMFSILQKQCTRVMESYNKNIITGISESFSVINESAEKQGMRIIKLPVATSLIYRESDDQSRHALEIHQLGREFDTIAYLDSAVTYNDATGAFEFYRCSAADSARVIENIRSGGKKFYPYTPYITEQTRADGSHGTVITYYCYDYLRDDTMKGVVAINIRQEWLENILGSADADGINIMLCDNNGEIVYNYKKPGEAQVGYNDRLAANPGGSFRARSDGSRCFVTVGALPASDYYIGLRRDLRRLYEPDAHISRRDLPDCAGFRLFRGENARGVHLAPDQQNVGVHHRRQADNRRCFRGDLRNFAAKFL